MNVDIFSDVCGVNENEEYLQISTNTLSEHQRNEYVEYRGMWCDGYKIVNRSEVLKLVNYAKEHNFNAISPLINAHSAGVFYDSELYPKHIDVQPNFNPLMTLCIEAHKHGIEIHPWVHAMVNPFAGSDHPEWRQVSSSGGAEASWINPAHPGARAHVVEMMMEIASYPVDGIRMDALRYRGSQYSYDAYSNQAFANSGYSNRAQWQVDQVTGLLRMINVEINKFKPYLWLSADVHWSYSTCLNSRYQDVRAWTAEELVDYLAIMDYTTNDNTFANYIADWVSHKDSNLVYSGPYVYVPGNSAYGSVSTEEEGINHLVTQIERTRSVGADGINIFKYEFLRTHPTYGWALAVGPYAMYARPPVMEQTVPVRKQRWEFNEPSMREGWELYPRRNDYPFNGRWEIQNAVSGTELLSPLIDLAPNDVTTLELRARNYGEKPVTLNFEWRKGPEMVRDPSAENLTFILAPDNTFHIYSIRLDSVVGWNIIRSRNDINISNISRIQLSVISENDAETTIAFDYIRLVSFPVCQKKWLLLGPFPNVDYDHAMDINHLRMGDNTSDDEKIFINPKPGDIMSGKEWQLFNTSRDYIDYKNIDMASEFNAMYAFSSILADPGGDYYLLMGADDGVMVWVNGELVMEEEGIAVNSEPNEFMIPISLTKGLNSLLIKVVQESDEFGFYARVTELNNQTVDNNVTFYPVLPPIPAPVPDDHMEGWNITSTPCFQFDLISVGATSPFFEVSTYWWRVDSGEPHSILVTERDRTNGYIEIELPEQSNGVHVFAVKGQDKLGRNGSWGIHEFNIDRAVPIYSAPIPDKTMIVAQEGKEGPEQVTWTWMVTNMPSSDIVQTEMMIGTGPGKFDIFNNTVPGAVTSFVFPISTDRHEFIYLSVVPLSGAGMAGPLSASSEGVVVDFTPPERITSMELDILRSADHRIVDAYVISWNPVRDREVGTGIDHYVLEYSSQNMIDWNVLARTSGTDNSFRFADPKRSERYKFRIYAVDGAGNRGLLSEELATPNLAPSAVISSVKVETGNISSGETIFLSSHESYDPDGEITSYFWNFGDGTFSYRPWAYHTYRYPQKYNLSLSVYDDFGKHNLTLIALNVTEPREDDPNSKDGTGMNWTTGAPNDPGGENENNDKVGEGADTDADNVPFSEILKRSMVSYVLLGTFFLFILLFGGVFCSSIFFRRRERANFTRYKSPGTERRESRKKLKRHQLENKEKGKK